MPSPLQAFAAILCVLVIGHDLYARRVPNSLLLAALGFGGCWLLWMVMPGASFSIEDALLGMLLGLVAMLPFHLAGWMGAGDVKFFAVLGFLLGWHVLLPVWIVGSLICGFHAVLVLALRTARQALPAAAAWQSRIDGASWRRRMLGARRSRRGLPYAAHLAIATLVVVFDGLPGTGSV